MDKLFERMVIAARSTVALLESCRQDVQSERAGGKKPEDVDSIDVVAQRVAGQVLGNIKNLVAEDDETTQSIPLKGAAYLTLDALDGGDVYRCSESPDYGVMIARVAYGKPRQGVIFLPEYDLLLGAAPGRVFLQDRQADNQRHRLVCDARS